MKHVEACLSARDGPKSRSYNCGVGASHRRGDPVRLVQACLCAVKT